MRNALAVAVTAALFGGGLAGDLAALASRRPRSRRTDRGGGGAVPDEEIAVVGGFLASGRNSTRADAYSPIRNRWRRLPEPSDAGRPCDGGRPGLRLVVGGYGPGSAALSTAFVLRQGRWNPLPPMPAPRAAAGAAVAREAVRRRRRRGARPAGEQAFAFDFEDQALVGDRRASRVNIWAPLRWAESSTPSRAEPPASTRTSTSSRPTTRVQPLAGDPASAGPARRNGGGRGRRASSQREARRNDPHGLRLQPLHASLGPASQSPETATRARPGRLPRSRLRARGRAPARSHRLGLEPGATRRAVDPWRPSSVRRARRRRRSRSCFL